LGRTVNLIQGAARVVTQSAEATVAAAGAVGGAAVNGVIGGVQGAVTGIKSSGSHSTPAAALAIAAIGATGLVEWPILLGVGGTAIVVRHLKQRSEGRERPTLAAVPNSPQRTSAAKRTPAAKRTSGRKAAKSTASSARKSASRNRRAAANR